MALKAVYAATIIASILVGLGIANATPNTLPAVKRSTGVVPVANGCGPYMRRDMYGVCRSQRGPRMMVRPMMPPQARPPVRRCGPGMVWRHGRCWY